MHKVTALFNSTYFRGVIGILTMLAAIAAAISLLIYHSSNNPVWTVASWLVYIFAGALTFAVFWLAVIGIVAWRRARRA